MCILIPVIKNTKIYLKYNCVSYCHLLVMHHVRLTNTLLLLTYLTLVIECDDSMWCKPGMTYHRHTHTCMTVVNVKRQHHEANQYCAKHFSGHLVYIFDAETNNFTKSLLRNNDWHHIGLNDIEQNGVYKWGNGQVAYYTDFLKNDKPNEMMEYVIMYKVYWSETYDSKCKFICQTTAENELFFLNGSISVNGTLVTTAQKKGVWHCRVFDREKHSLELLYRKIDGTILHLWNVSGTDLDYEMTTDCNSSGVYICRVTNRLSGNVSNFERILKVKCDATNCSDRNSNIKLLVADHSGCTKGKFCLFMYPAENLEARVYNLKNTNVPIQKSRYNIGFTYTDVKYTKGEIIITFCNVTSSDYGRYVISLWNKVENLSTLYFNISEKAKEAQHGQPSENNIVFYVIPIVAVVITVATSVVIIVLVIKRKNRKDKKTFTDQKGFKYNCGSETISTQQSSPDNANSSANTLAPVCSTEVAENIYNNVLEQNAQQGAKVLKPARKSGSSIKLKDKVSLTTGENQAATLPLGKTLVTWDDEKDDVNVYENARNDTSNQVEEFENEENKETPSNEDKVPPQELDGEKEAKPKEESRTLSPEGLVYVSVEINRSSRTPKIVVQKPKVTDKKKTKDNKKKEVKEVKPSYDAVEYSSLDYLATSVAATEDTEELNNE